MFETSLRLLIGTWDPLLYICFKLFYMIITVTLPLLVIFIPLILTTILYNIVVKERIRYKVMVVGCVIQVLWLLSSIKFMITIM
jgi:hypothetical protein